MKKNYYPEAPVNDVFTVATNCQHCGQVHKGHSRISREMARNNAVWEVDMCGRNHRPAPPRQNEPMAENRRAAV